MSTIRYNWNDGDVDHVFDMVHVEGTNGCPYGFGVDDAVRSIEIQSFFIATVPVTQALWAHVMGGDNPSVGRGARLPLENVSWDEITRPGGFLHRLNRLLGARGFDLAGTGARPGGSQGLAEPHHRDQVRGTVRRVVDPGVVAGR